MVMVPYRMEKSTMQKQNSQAEHKQRMGLTQELGLFIHRTRREGRRDGSDANRLEYLAMRGYESSPLRGEIVNVLHQRVGE